ncbi:MAG: glycerophosphodiester phosphodiesterase [Clostridia bacterium]|nr:glycerophosphodiester phosphodiesterase [Clostridia bacterium]
MWTMIDILLGVLSVIAALCLIFALIYLLVLIRPCAKKPKKNTLLCDYAHRGLHGKEIPENSLAAFALACEKGYGIELDVQLSRDGTVMVFHDATLSRMTGKEKKLCELNAEELQTLSLAGTAEKIPTFAEVLSLVNGRVPLLVELKGEDFDTSLCEKTAALLSAYGGDFCIESFNPLLIRDMKKYLPDAFYGILYTNVCREKKKNSLLNIALTLMATNILARPDFIAYDQRERHSFPVKLTTKFYRAPKFVWTVRTEEMLAAAHQNGECVIFEKNEF